MHRALTLYSATAIAVLAAISHSLECHPALGQTGTREYQEPPAKTGQITWSTDADGQHYVTTLKISRLRETPKWGDDKENPPLSARRAIVVAQGVIDKLAPYGKEAKLKAPTLKLKQSNGHWFWVVYFTPNDFRQFQSTFPVVVLMDGTSVVPVKGRVSGLGGDPQKQITIACTGVAEGADFRS